jgi:hypothetical protein
VHDADVVRAEQHVLPQEYHGESQQPLIRLVEQLQAENRTLCERLRRRRCGACGALQQWRAVEEQ